MLNRFTDFAVWRMCWILKRTRVFIYSADTDHTVGFSRPIISSQYCRSPFNSFLVIIIEFRWVRSLLSSHPSNRSVTWKFPGWFATFVAGCSLQVKVKRNRWAFKACIYAIRYTFSLKWHGRLTYAVCFHSRCLDMRISLFFYFKGCTVRIDTWPLFWCPWIYFKSTITKTCTTLIELPASLPFRRIRIAINVYCVTVYFPFWPWIAFSKCLMLNFFVGTVNYNNKTSIQILYC